MAAGLNGTILVEQTLHGYDDGHRRLAGSFRGSPGAARSMLVLSDLSASSTRIGPQGYLTGYPLISDGRYVIARTWEAPEMPRPGCVWTHSLVIQFADLASLPTALPLLDLFHRPEDDHSIYDATRRIPIDYPIPAAAETRVLGQLVQALYGAPARKVVAQIADAAADEEMLLAIWMQQWPRLRRSFRFCSHAGADRSTATDAFDLQFVQSVDRMGLSRFPGAVAASDGIQSDDLRRLVDDLVEPDAAGLRSFLRTVGGDIAGGRAAVAGLCRLHSLLRNPTATNLSAAVEPLEALGPSQGRAARHLVASAALDATAELDETLVEFVVRTVATEAADGPDEAVRSRLGLFLWRQAPGRFAAALEDGSFQGEAARSSMHQLTSEEIISGLTLRPDLAAPLVVARPALMERVEFWRLPTASREMFVAAQPRALTDETVRAVVAAGRRDLSRDIFNWRNPREMLRALGGFEPPDPLELSRWYDAISWDRWQIAAALSELDVSTRGSLAALTLVVDPDDIPNDYGDDPWWSAYSAAPDTHDAAREDLLAAFLMVRALGWRSRSPAQLLRATFDKVHSALDGERLDRRARALLDRRFSWSTRRERNPSVRLRDAVVDRFVDARLDPETFGRLTDMGGLWKSLADMAARTGRGRDFLWDVRSTILDAAEEGIRQRAVYIGSIARRR